MLLVIASYHNDRKIASTGALGDVTLAHLFPDSQTTWSLVWHRPQNNLYFQIRGEKLIEPDAGSTSSFMSYFALKYFVHCIYFYLCLEMCGAQRTMHRSKFSYSTMCRAGC